MVEKQRVQIHPHWQWEWPERHKKHHHHDGQKKEDVSITMISRLWNHLEKEKFGPYWVEKAESEIEKWETWSITQQSDSRAVGLDWGTGWDRKCECIIGILMGGGQRQGIGVGGIIIFIFLFFFYGVQNTFQLHGFWGKQKGCRCKDGENINILSLEKDKGQHVSQGILWFIWSLIKLHHIDRILHNWQGLDRSLIHGQKQSKKPHIKALCKWVHYMKL